MKKNNYKEIIENYYINKSINRETFENQIDELTKQLLSPEKEFYRIYAYLYYNNFVPKNKRDYLIDNVSKISESATITDEEKNVIKCATMNASFSNGNYNLAERYAKELMRENLLTDRIKNDIANYYTKTRRYNIAKDLYNSILEIDNEVVSKDYKDFQNIVNGIKSPYLPAIPENRDKYLEFMNTLGIDTENLIKSDKKQPKKIEVGQYPLPVEITNPGFLDFVAFDLETTGIDYSKDAITEIAAIKVRNGVIVEEKNFLFQELVKPYKKRIPANVEKITGITNDMVNKARNIWEVFTDFAEFIGDDILVGYNCMIFDSKFLVRAGRLSNLIINNKYFDVMKMAQKYKNVVTSKNMTLVEFGESIGIKNPQAHRALADAITTAKVYLKLLEI